MPLPAAGAARPAPAQRGTDSCPERAPARRSPALPCPRAARSHPAPPPHPWTAAAGRWAAGPCRRCEPGRGAAEPRAAGTMDSILEPFAAERLFPPAGPGFLDLGDFSEADFLSNVVRGAARPRPARGARPESPLPALGSRSAFFFSALFALTARSGLGKRRAGRGGGSAAGGARLGQRWSAAGQRNTGLRAPRGRTAGQGVPPPVCSQLLGQSGVGETKRPRPGVRAGMVCFREQGERKSDLGGRAAASPKEPKGHCSPLRKLPGLPTEPCEPRTPQFPPLLLCLSNGSCAVPVSSSCKSAAPLPWGRRGRAPVLGWSGEMGSILPCSSSEYSRGHPNGGCQHHSTAAGGGEGRAVALG